MINVWDYANKLPVVKIETFDGEVFEGEIIHVFDTEEDEDWPEDGMFVESRNGKIETFFQSELKSVEIVK